MTLKVLPPLCLMYSKNEIEQYFLRQPNFYLLIVCVLVCLQDTLHLEAFFSDGNSALHR